jgi:hypothetical protein
MPIVDVLDLNNRKVGDLELSDAVFGAEVKEHLIYESVRHYMACRRQGSRGHENARHGCRFWQEAVAAEGYRPRPYGFGALPDLAARRHRARPAAPRLFLPVPAEDAAGCASQRAKSAKLRDGELKIVKEFEPWRTTGPRPWRAC